MEFVEKKVNIDILNPFITSPTKKGHTYSKKSSYILNKNGQMNFQNKVFD